MPKRVVSEGVEFFLRICVLPAMAVQTMLPDLVYARRSLAEKCYLLQFCSSKHVAVIYLRHSALLSARLQAVSIPHIRRSKHERAVL